MKNQVKNSIDLNKFKNQQLSEDALKQIKGGNGGNDNPPPPEDVVTDDILDG